MSIRSIDQTQRRTSGCTTCGVVHECGVHDERFGIRRRGKSPWLEPVQSGCETYCRPPSDGYRSPTRSVTVGDPQSRYFLVTFCYFRHRASLAIPEIFPHGVSSHSPHDDLAGKCVFGDDFLHLSCDTGDCHIVSCHMDNLKWDQRTSWRSANYLACCYLTSHS